MIGPSQLMHTPHTARMSQLPGIVHLKTNTHMANKHINTVRMHAKVYRDRDRSTHTTCPQVTGDRVQTKYG